MVRTATARFDLGSSRSAALENESARPALAASSGQPDKISKNAGSPETGHRRDGPAPAVVPVLWIDDEVESDDALFRLLSMEGFHVDVAESGAEGLAKSRSGGYAAIILDLRLPAIFGLTVLERIVRRGASTPVVAVSGYYLEPEIETAALRAGAAAFRHKPFFEVEDLAQLLRGLMARSRQSAHGSGRVASLAAIPAELAAESPAMRGVVDWIGRIGRTNHTALITGETGTGKEPPLRLYELQVIKREVIAGYETLAVRGNRTTEWYAPTLNCAILKATTVFSPDQVYEESLVSVTPGEPSPTLLTVPAHYKEVPPSGIKKTNSSVINDKYYYAHRPPAHLIAGEK